MRKAFLDNPLLKLNFKIGNIKDLKQGLPIGLHSIVKPLNRFGIIFLILQVKKNGMFGIRILSLIVLIEIYNGFSNLISEVLNIV